MFILFFIVCIIWCFCWLLDLHVLFYCCSLRPQTRFFCSLSCRRCFEMTFVGIWRFINKLNWTEFTDKWWGGNSSLLFYFRWRSNIYGFMNLVFLLSALWGFSFKVKQHFVFSLNSLLQKWEKVWKRRFELLSFVPMLLVKKRDVSVSAEIQIQMLESSYFTGDGTAEAASCCGSVGVVWPEALKVCPHWPHLNGLSLVWLRWWTFRLLIWLKAFQHRSQRWGLSPVWVSWCLIKCCL